MTDANFKSLKHHAPGYIKYSNGQEVEKNYSPDYVLIRDNSYILLEHESEPNRKTIVADMIKAAHFLQGEKVGILVIVLTPKRKSSLESYPKHIKKYFDWVGDKTNLEEIYFIRESDYQADNDIIEINSHRFIDLSYRI
ncbi:MAG: hypothetical protein HQ521_17810 [Bacteroidetes bacterium]|nr:hypothetical protein [Bacteroidota bacterium]